MKQISSSARLLVRREEDNRYAKYIPMHSAAWQRTFKPSPHACVSFLFFFFCRYQSYCFPPRELLLLARGGHFLCELCSILRQFQQTCNESAFKTATWKQHLKKNREKKGVALEKLGWDGGGLFSLVSDFYTRWPNVELGIQQLLLLQTVGQLQQFVYLWMCPGVLVRQCVSQLQGPWTQL